MGLRDRARDPTATYADATATGRAMPGRRRGGELGDERQPGQLLLGIGKRKCGADALLKALHGVS